MTEGRDSRAPAPWHGGFRLWLRSGRVVVAEESMRPALLPGDRLLYDPRAYARHLPQPGEIVVLIDPEHSRELLVKRVGRPAREIPPGHLWVVGDAPERSWDSRQFGPVPLGMLLGRVWFRYAPRERRTRL